jgi:hypothetical protein
MGWRDRQQRDSDRKLPANERKEEEKKERRKKRQVVVDIGALLPPSLPPSLPEMLASHGEHGPMSMDPLTLHQENHVRKVCIVDQAPVGGRAGGRAGGSASLSCPCQRPSASRG